MMFKKFFVSIILFISIIITCSSLSLASSDIIVALDPGHGGNDPGAIGENLRESDLTWKIASRVKEILDKEPGITGVLTKGQYETLDSQNDRKIRAERAVENNADLLVSFHINSNDYSNSLSGAEVYITGYTAEDRFYKNSNILGLDILANLRNVGVKSHSPKPITRIGEDWDRYEDGSIADYYGIISWPVHMGIPGMIIEHAFINNPYDRTYYLNDTMLNRMAEADAKAIIKNKELFRREYYGSINTELINLDYIIANGNQNYIQGYIYIAEWIDGECKTPTEVPKLTLKSTDGKVSTDLYISHEDGIKYYFDKNIDNLDLNKEYYIEAKLTNKKNLEAETNKIQRVRLQDKILKENYKDRKFKIVNNKLVFSEGPYEGKIDTKLDGMKLIENSAGDTYISGYVDINEVIENKTRVPIAMPEIRIKSTDGKVNDTVYVGYEDGNRYYFDKNIEYLDRTKTYYLEASLMSEDNIAPDKDKKQIIEIGSVDIEILNGITITVNEDMFTISYYGTINTELSKMNIIQNSSGDNYISGKIYIAEWVDGSCRTPTKLPEMRLKSTDGTIDTKMYISYEDGIEYYYDKNIQNLDTSKEYYIEVSLVDTANVAKEEEKIQTAKFSTSTVNGKLTDGRKLEIVNKNYLRIIDETLYYGTINTELHDIKIIQNGLGNNYISGYIYIAEWINGECKTPSTIPEMYLKSTDGTVDAKMYVGYEGGIEYYFDKDIEKIDISKEYYIEVVLTSKKNLSDENSKKQEAKITKKGQVGICTNGNKVILNGNKIKVEPNLYRGTINTELYDIKIIQNEAGDNYISGYIYIAEWINGECKTPSAIPEMYLKSTDGTYETKMYVGYEGEIEYYFDKDIEAIDISKEYYIEAILTNPNNQENKENQKQVAKITKQGQIGICTNGNIVTVDGNNIYIKENVKVKEENIMKNLNETTKESILEMEQQEIKVEENNEVKQKMEKENVQEVQMKEDEIVEKDKENNMQGNKVLENKISIN